MGAEQLQTHESEGLTHTPHLIIASKGRAQNIRHILPSSGYTGISEINPIEIMDDEELRSLGLPYARGYLMQVLTESLITPSEIPEVLNTKYTHNITESTRGRANYKTLRAIAHHLALYPETKDCLVIGRDTTQILVHEDDKHISQERPGNTFEDQYQAALELEASKFALISTATAIKGIAGQDSQLNWLRKIYSQFHADGPQTLGLSPALYQVNSLTPLLLRVRGVKNLPPECFTNLPGGLDYDHPLVQAICEWTPIIRLPWLWLSHLDRHETFTPFNELSEEDKAVVQMTRKGVPPDLKKHIEKALSWFKNLNGMQKAIRDYLYEGIT